MQKLNIKFFQFEIFVIKTAKKHRKLFSKTCNILHHNFKSILCYIPSDISLKRFNIALFDDELTLKTLKVAYIGLFYSNFSLLFVIQTKALLTICRLIVAKADVDMLNSKGESPRHLAASESSEAGIEFVRNLKYQ